VAMKIVLYLQESDEGNLKINLLTNKILSIMKNLKEQIYTDYFSGYVTVSDDRTDFEIAVDGEAVASQEEADKIEAEMTEDTRQEILTQNNNIMKWFIYKERDYQWKQSVNQRRYLMNVLTM